MLSSKTQRRNPQIEDRQARKYGLKEMVQESAASRTERINVRAYHLWLEAGKRKGHDMEFWLQAEREDNEK